MREMCAFCLNFSAHFSNILQIRKKIFFIFAAEI